MNIIKVASVLVVLGALTVTVAPSAMADHGKATVANAEGSSVPGCEQNNECFIPYTVTIDEGGEVTWTNVDTAAHTITSGSTADGFDGVFDSGLVSPGVEFSHVFEEVGEYPYFCLVHPWMSGVVIVQSASADTGEDTSMMDEPGMMMDAEPSGMTMLSDGTEVMLWATEPMAGESMTIDITFKDSEHVNYDIMAVQGDTVVLDIPGAHEHGGMGTHTTDRLASDDPVDVTVTFQGFGVDEMTGPQGEMLMFAQIVPEFGTIAVLVLAVAIVSIVVVTARSGLSIVPRY